MKSEQVKHHCRFFVDSSSIQGDFFITKDKELINQIKNVFRLHGHGFNGDKEGDRITVLDDTGWEYEFNLENVNNKNVDGYLVEKNFYEEDKRKVILYIPLLKKEKFEMILQKCTELGISEFFPTAYKNCVVKDSGKKERWQKIVKEASEQCGRKRIPVIHAPKEFGSIIDGLDKENTFASYENGELLICDLAKKKLVDNEINILVGPEGGFSELEVELFRKRGFPLFNINQNVLRSETACIVSVGFFTSLC